MYLKRHGTRRVPQWVPLPGQAPNSAGGFAWAVDVWARLRRFLVLGSEGGSYYASEWTLTRENAHALEAALQEDGRRAIAEIVAVSRGGRAPKNDPALFALAMAAGVGDEVTRKAALAALSQVARTGTHLFQFASFSTSRRSTADCSSGSSAAARPTACPVWSRTSSAPSARPRRQRRRRSFASTACRARRSSRST